MSSHKPSFPLPDRRAYALIACAIAATLLGCRSSTDSRDIIASAIRHQGGPLLDRMELSFELRDRRYRVLRDDGLFRYERYYADSTGEIHDVVNNDDLYRELNGERVNLDSARSRSVYSGVNSTVYFALIPQPLGDAAVRSRYLGSAQIDGHDYHEIEVTFVQDGGGLDYQDRFVYWIRTDPPVVDYLAYYYYTDGGGSRFRKAVNQRRVGGVLFADYENYSAPRPPDFTGIESYDTLFLQDSLSLVSEINLENISVRQLSDNAGG
jgi:hypothetical protein